MRYAFAAPPQPSVEIRGLQERFPVRRIFCVGRNYAAHARELGNDDREPPFFFTKPADAVVPNNATIRYPSRTANLHHEVELVVALGPSVGQSIGHSVDESGRNIPVDRALDLVYGYAVGNDLTRRDLQFESRDKGRPWDTAKAFDRAAPITAITPVAASGHIRKGRIWMTVNGELRQQGDISDLIWTVPEIIAELSTLFALAPGDLIFTGTPAGVSPLKPGDRVEGGVEGLENLLTIIGPP